MKHLLISALSALVIGASALTSPAMAAESGESHVEDIDFSFEGPFGTFDQQQLRRGFQVYREVCSACHGLRYVAFRTLADQGGPMMDPKATV